MADRDRTGLERTVALARERGAEAGSFVGNMSSASDVESFITLALERHGRVDALHCNAGITGELRPIYEYPEAQFDEVFVVNAKGVFLALRYALPVMIKQGSGAVVVSCSIASLGGLYRHPAYVGSKHAALGLVRAAAMDVARLGVRVNAVCPGSVDTPMLASVIDKISPGDPDEGRARFAAASMSGRFATGEDVAEAVLFLCSGAARNINGTYLTVDGGVTAAASTGAA